MATAEAFIRAARSYIGTPYHHAGRVKGPNGGVDCIGAVCGAMAEIGYPFADVANYSRRASRKDSLLYRKCLETFDEVPINHVRPGMIGLFWVDHTLRIPQHACVFTWFREGIGMVHAWENSGRVRTRHRGAGAGQGSVIEQEFSRFWKPRLCHAFELRGVEPWRA